MAKFKLMKSFGFYHSLFIVLQFELVSNCNRLPAIRRPLKAINFDIDGDVVTFHTEEAIRDRLSPGRQVVNRIGKAIFNPLVTTLQSGSGIEIQREDSEDVAREKGESVKFYLFTRNNPEERELLTKDIKNSKYWDKNAKVKIFIHGWAQTTNVTVEALRPLTGTPERIKNAYLEMNRPENIVLVDWNKLSFVFNYFHVIRSTYSVALKVSEFVQSLVNENVTRSYDDIHLIGFSLGGHIAGMTGHLVYQNTGIKVARITGLDPAGPGFEKDIDEKYRLDKDDALFVDVIHCSAGDLLSDTDRVGRAGTKYLSGHVDFFPDGGVMQPGCIDFTVDFCSHHRCPKMFTDSIRGKKYFGCPCSTILNSKKGRCDCENPGPILGEFCPKSAKGFHYVNTFPYNQVPIPGVI